MGKKSRKARLEVEAIVVGYAMSRLDRDFLKARKHKTWKDAFEQAGKALEVTPASIKNLRDEFDPLHDNRRRGWYQRPLRPNRQRVLAELCEVSEAALFALVDRILGRDETAVAEAIDSLVAPSRVVHNVAERLQTGRRAEEYFLLHSKEIIGVEAEDILDCRQSCRGFDFGVRGHPNRFIEVKGLKGTRGPILFTDREWSEARLREDEYWLVVVGNLAKKPRPRLIRDPASVLEVTCRYQASVAATWHSTVDLNA